MTVTGIEAHTKSRYKIYIDRTFAFVLYKGELATYGIKLDEEVSEENYNEIMQKILPKRAKLRCMNLLKSRRYTRKQMENKLKQGFYPETIVCEALDYVESYGYLNDRQYVIDYIEYSQSQKSRVKIRQDLMKKGIPFEITDDIWSEIAEGDSEEMERLQIVKYLEKKGYNPENATIQEKNKLFSYLYRKGFQIEIIKSLLLV